jgi:hypothetical protein
MKLIAALPRPYPPYAWRTARNAAVLWLLLHLAASFFGIGLSSVFTGVAMVSITAALVRFDGRRFHEHLFHANLGTPPAWETGIALAIAGVLETVAQLLVR